MGKGGGLRLFAQVIVDIIHENVAHTFTYRVPQGMELSVGQRVEVPFGPRRLEGVVLSFSDTCELPENKIRAILAPMEDYPAILPPLIASK